MEKPIGKASIIVLTYDNIILTRRCLQSIYDKTQVSQFEVIVVDNASQDDTPQFLEKFSKQHKNFSFILNQENTGFAAGNNIGIRMATGEFLVLLNNDTIVTYGWLDGLLRHLQDKEVGLVGPVTNSASNEARILPGYEDVKDLDEFVEEYSQKYRGEYFEIQTLAFLCVALRREVYDEIGPLDERFGLGMFEDDDYALRLHQNGYKLRCAEDVYIHHEGGSSFLKMDQMGYWQLFRENRSIFEKKWGKKWKPHLHRRDLIPFQISQLTDWGYDLQWKLLNQKREYEILIRNHQVLENQFAVNKQQNSTEEKYIQELTQQLGDQNAYIKDLTQQKDKYIDELLERIRTLDDNLKRLTQEKDRYIQELLGQIESQDNYLKKLTLEKDQYINELLEQNQTLDTYAKVLIAEKDRVVRELNQNLDTMENELEASRDQLSVQENKIRDLIQENNRHLQKLADDSAEREKYVLELEQKINNLSNDIVIASQKISSFEHQVSGLHGQLQEIQISRAWQFIRWFWEVRLKLIPQSSFRERVLFAIIHRTSKLVGIIIRKKNNRNLRNPKYKGKNLNDGDFDEDQWKLDLSLKIENSDIAILTPQFYDYFGKEVYIGGAERYLINLTKLIKDMGWKPIIFQAAYEDWEKEFNGLRIYGIKTGGDLRKLNMYFHKIVPADMLVIYHAFNLATPYCQPRSIGIGHGVYWDEKNQLTTVDQQKRIKDLLLPMENLNRLVTVDTNMINWVRSFNEKLPDKFSYIPNFVDLSHFKPPIKRNTDQLIVLYPRRLYPPRGFWLVHDLIPEFLDHYPELSFHFVGQANPREEKAVTKLKKRYPDQVQWYTLPLEKMHLAYQKADITLIPTIHSEGTSLSCLEAMASGSAVIATNVGGLPDLILSDHNGLLIEPNLQALKDALHKLCMDNQLRSSIAKNGVLVASTFGLERWRSSWAAILQEMMVE